jgi:antitoxin VapB
MGEERPAKLFRNGRSQAVRIPRDFELPGKDAVWRKEDDGRLVLEQPRQKSVQRLLARLRAMEPLGEEDQFPEIEDLPPKPFTLLDDL